MAQPLQIYFAGANEFDRSREDGGRMKRLQATAKIFFLFFVFSIALEAQSIYELPAGTRIRVRMDNEINSKVSSVDDTFTMKIAEPVIVREIIVLPVGTVIEGRVTRVTTAASGGKDGEMEVKFETLLLTDGARRRIEGVLVNPLKAEKSSPAVNVLTIAGGAALGAIVGAVSGADNGALIGAGIGAGAGTGAVYLRKGRDVRIKADEKFEIELTKNVILPVQDF